MDKKTTNIHIAYRILTAEDARVYREIRLSSLMSEDRRFFATDRYKEKQRSIDEWRIVCTETCDYALLGAFVGKKLVGAASVERWTGDKSGKTAYYRAAYVRPGMRKTEAAGGLHVRLGLWAVKHGCDKSLFAIRADNREWLKRQISYGAKIKETVLMRYVDGEEALTCLLERPLHSEPVAFPLVRQERPLLALTA